MQSPYRLDHVVIAVSDLTTAIADYRALGFTVIQGGEHEKWGTHNALIPLQDDSYLELIAFKADAAQRLATYLDKSPVEERLQRWGVVGEGLVDFALLPEDTAQQITAARDRGIHMGGPLPGSRIRPDGQVVAWNFGFPDSSDLPFLCGDVTARSLRVPSGDARHHPNGVAGIESVTVVVRDLGAATARYRALLGPEVLDEQVTAESGERVVRFELGSQSILLVTPRDEASALKGYLAERGEGVYEVRLRTLNPGAVGSSDLARTHGARLILVPAVPDSGSDS